MPRVVRGYKEAAKSSITQAAIEVFASKGFYASTMEEIAQKLGVSKGAIYQYFNSKEDLLKEIQSSSRQWVRGELKRAFENHEPTKGAEVFFDTVFVKFEIGLRNSIDLFSVASHDEKLRRILREDHDTDLKIIEDFLGELIAKGKVHPRLNKKLLSRMFSAISFEALVELSLGYEMQVVRKGWVDSISALFGKS